MSGNTIHNGPHSDKHWAGLYFGPDGALEESRKALAVAVRREKQEALAFPGYRRAVISAQMVLMSTVFSAISHCASQVKLGMRTRNPKAMLWYGWTAAKLLFELDHLVYAVVADEDTKAKLEPGERDVLIASLMAARYVSWHPDFWYQREARKLVLQQIESRNVSGLFAMARAVAGKMGFTQSELDDFKEEVEFAIVANAPDGALPFLSWSDVARLARMVGDTERQQYAAAKDGTFDAKLKAGIINN